MLVELCPSSKRRTYSFSRTKHPSRARGNHMRAGWPSQRAYLAERCSITRFLEALKARKSLLEVLVFSPQLRINRRHSAEANGQSQRPIPVDQEGSNRLEEGIVSLFAVLQGRIKKKKGKLLFVLRASPLMLSHLIKSLFRSSFQ